MKETETQKAIEAEAKELYPDGGNFALLRRQGFIAGRSKSLEEKEKEIEVTEKLLSERQRVLDAIPECPEHGGNCVPHALEWIAATQKEIAELKAWKQSSLSVTPDMQAIGKALGLRLGESVHDKILPGIERLKDLISTAHAVGYQSGYKSGSNHDATEFTANKSWQQFKTENNL